MKNLEQCKDYLEKMEARKQAIQKRLDLTADEGRMKGLMEELFAVNQQIRMLEWVLTD